jgi:outer membrane putative beta-barrel porin/alpha-amylase
MSASTTRVAIPAVILQALLLSFPARAETRLDLRFIPSYFSGEFATGFETHILSLASTLVVERGKHEFRLDVPYVSITADGLVTFLGDQVIERGPGGRTTESGPGDLMLQDEYSFVEGSRSAPTVSAIIKFKVPTADESRGLGSGEPDGGLGFGLSQPLGTRWAMLGQTQYMVRGDPPGTDLKDTFAVSIGFQRRVSDSTSAMLSYKWLQSVISGRSALADISLGCDHSFARKLTLRTTAYYGLSETAEDYGFAAGISLR